MFLVYEDIECMYPPERIYGFAAYGAEMFMNMAADLFSIFPIKNSAFINGRRIEVEMDDKCKKNFSIKSLDTNRVFDCLKYSNNVRWTQ